MIGIVVVTHSRLASALIESAEFILKSKIEAIEPVSIDLNENVDSLRKKIDIALKKANRNSGLLILTDMFGGTPSNLSYSFLEEGRVEVITGVNLPILIKAISGREKKTLDILAAELELYGKNSISLASGILKGNKKDRIAAPR